MPEELVITSRDLATLTLARDSALFLDFDGTLVDLADAPDAVTVPDSVADLLVRLEAMLDGAVAVVSGRRIAELSQFLAPADVSLVGLHGLEMHRFGGPYELAVPVTEAAEAAAVTLERFAGAHDGVLFERKGPAMALHYRNARDCEAAVLDAVRQAIEPLDGYAVMHGKMVVEAKPAGFDKGRAVRELMTEAPYSGRTPIVIGDDVTDEDAFKAVEDLGGLTVKVGDGETHASLRAADPSAVRAWLTREVERHEHSGSVRTRGRIA